MALQPGDKIDRYTIVRRLGAGGMGEVYRARDERLHRDVALKVLVDRDGREDDESRARLLREARAAAALDHPDVVAIHDVAEAASPPERRGTAYLTMELVEGRPLRDYVGDASVPRARRVAWLAAVARALDAAHRRGFVHRDVKPGNVMIRDDGAVKVLDFGVARPILLPARSDATTEASTGDAPGDAALAGTLAYMAPEQLKREPVDGRCDQFGWGVMAYELLAGRRPWRPVEGVVHLVTEVLTYEPPSVASIAPEVPAQVAAVIARAMAKSPDARWPTMGDAARAIEAGDAPPAAEDEAPRSPRRGRAAATAIAIGVAGALVFATARHRARPATDARDAGLAADGPECATRAACVDAHGGEAWTCHAGRCAPLAAPRCEVLAAPADLRDERTVWIGAMTGGDAATRNAVELARRDFAALPRSLVATGATRRPLAFVACDDVEDPRRALRHLLDDVRVPAVIGFYSSEEAVQLLSEELVPRGALTLVANNPAPQITALRTPPDRPRLIWRTTNDAAQMASAVSALVAKELEPRRRAARPGPVTLALVRARTVTGVGFSDALVSSLALNGASVAADPRRFVEIVFDADVAAGAPALAEARDALLRARPDVVVYFGGELFDLLLRDVDRAWPAATLRPVYVSGLPFDADVLRGLDDASLRRRMFAVTTPASTPANAKFTLHYNATFADRVTATSSPNTTYDAAYVLGYALYALGDRPVDGASLAAEIARLVRGPSIEVGPAKLLEGLGTLSAGGAIDLAGAGGGLDFDLATGSSRPDHVVLCVGRDDRGALVGVEAGLAWDARTGALRGALACP